MYDLSGLFCYVPITATHNSFPMFMALVFDVSWHYLSRICLRIEKRVQYYFINCIWQDDLSVIYCTASKRRGLSPMRVVHRHYFYKIICKRRTATFGVPLISVLVIFDLHFFPLQWGRRDLSHRAKDPINPLTDTKFAHKLC